jgi:hypothetical protein
MPSYPSYISCTFIVDIPWSQNAIIILFDDIFNGTAKETTKKYIEMMEYLGSLLPTVSTKVSAMWETTEKRCLICSLPNSVSQSKSLKGFGDLGGYLTLVLGITTIEPQNSKYGTSQPTIVRLTYWETQVKLRVTWSHQKLGEGKVVSLQYTYPAPHNAQLHFQH